MGTGRAARNHGFARQPHRAWGAAGIALMLAFSLASVAARAEEPPAPTPATGVAATAAVPSGTVPAATVPTAPDMTPAAAPAATPAPAPGVVPAAAPAAPAAAASPEPGTPSNTLELPPSTAPASAAGTPTGSLAGPAATPAAAPAPGATPAPGTAAASEGSGGLSQQLGSVFHTDKLKVDGYWWVHFNHVSSFPLDEKGGKDGLVQALDHRLRIRPTLALSPSVDIHANLDVLAGQLWGDTSSAAASEQLVPRNRNSFTTQSALRELYLEWRSKGGALRVGQVASQWGLGLVANNGEDRDENFADTRFGDRTERVQFTFQPATWGTDKAWAKGLNVSVAGDLVFWDDHADLVSGDKAWQFVGAVWWQGTAIPGAWDTFTGVYVAYRNQKYDDGDRLTATVVDLFTRHALPLGSKGTRLVLSLEGVVTTGRTDAVRFERAKNGVDLLQLGGVLRADLEVPAYHLVPSFELGLASGDKDSRDGTARGFTFDPDFQAGMILYKQVLGRMSAWAVSRASDPALSATPAKGYEQALTNGAITNSLYVYPRLKWSPMKGLDIRLAFLWARSMVPLVDAYSASVKNGGYPRSYRNGPPSTDLGWEIDGGISYKTPNFWGPFFVRLGLQGGWCKPGAAFADTNGKGLGAVWEARVLADLGF